MNVIIPTILLDLRAGPHPLFDECLGGLTWTLSQGPSRSPVPWRTRTVEPEGRTRGRLRLVWVRRRGPGIHPSCKRSDPYLCRDHGHRDISPGTSTPTGGSGEDMRWDHGTTGERLCVVFGKEAVDQSLSRVQGVVRGPRSRPTCPSKGTSDRGAVGVFGQPPTVCRSETGDPLNKISK